MSRGLTRPEAATIATIAVVAVIFRVWPRGALWLDEAQSVAIARAPLSQLAGLLRTDGAPPLYYVLLHGWMELFGDGTVAVRSLTVLISLAFLAALTMTTRKLVDRRTGWYALALAASSSFAIRYASEARMYSLVMLEVTGGLWLVTAVLERSGRTRLILLALITAALLYTHYWSVYLVAACGVALLLVAVRGGDASRRGHARVALLSIAAGVLLWLPWFPVFRDQSQRTSTPWTQPASLRSLFDSTFRPDRSDRIGAVVLVALLLLLVIGLLERRRDPIVKRSTHRAIAGVAAGTLGLAALGGAISGSAYVGRYSAVAFPLVIVVAAAGAAAIRPLLVQRCVIAALVCIGFGHAVDELRTPRTRAPVLAAALDSRVGAGDLIVYCPDQLAPALSRLLAEDPRTKHIDQIVYPQGRSRPARVDWIDYADRYAAAKPETLLALVRTTYPSSTVWLVWSGTYPATQQACNALADALVTARPDHRRVVPDDPSISDHGGLWRFDAGGAERLRR